MAAVTPRRNPTHNSKGQGDHSGRLCLLEDQTLYREILKERFEDAKFTVLTPVSGDECMDYLAEGCRAFVLDIGIYERKVEGLDTLERIKEDCPEAFCCVVTGDKRYRAQAYSLHADYFCQREEKDIEELVKKLNHAYMERRWDLRVLESTSVEVLGRHLRSKSNPVNPVDDVIRQAERNLINAFPYIEAYLAGSDFDGAARQLVLLEPSIRSLARLSSQRGEGFSIVIHALWNGILDPPDTGLRPEHWRTWRRTLDCLLSYKTIDLQEACRLADDLEDSGLTTTPPGWSDVPEALDQDDEVLS
jgi:DNA-binding NarL/FixJ family response regulator